MEPITYSLRAGDQNSDQYYRDVACFTDEVTAECEAHLGRLIDQFGGTHSRAEQMLELLTLGTLWHIYSDDAEELGAVPAAVLTRLAEWRQESPALKPAIDWARGILATLLLEPDDDPMAGYFTVAYLDKLLDWLAATGEFRQEVRHLRPWRDFFATRPAAETADHLVTAIAVAIWFEQRSLEALGRYTAGVDRFLTEEYPCHRWREDVIFTGRKRVEYHLNMVGAEWMNRAFRPAFDAQQRKLVLVPACMRRQATGQCQADHGGMGLRCAGCDSRCPVHHVSRLGEKHGFSVRILPHESDFAAAGSDRPQDLAIVGVACVTNLVAGGWKAQALGLPAQCVLLDYAGCQGHWDESGATTTEINLGQLKRILQITN